LIFYSIFLISLYLFQISARPECSS